MFKFRTPTRCQNGHFRWYFWEASFGEGRQQKWGDKEKDCKCPTFAFGEGFVRSGTDCRATGVFDKNGIEIYEYDLVKVSKPNCGLDGTYEVRWHPIGMWAYWCPKQFGRGVYDHGWKLKGNDQPYLIGQKNTEVIGHIFDPLD